MFIKNFKKTEILIKIIINLFLKHHINLKSDKNHKIFLQSKNLNKN